MRPSGSACEIETGTVFMNRCDYLDPGLAWTGVKDTGRGATLSQIGYETLTRPKSFHLRTSVTMELRGNWNYPTTRALRRRPHRGTGRGGCGRRHDTAAVRHRSRCSPSCR